MKPNFSEYTYEQLVESFWNVNRKKFPDSFEEILRELEKKKPSDVELIEVTSGYRLLKTDQIPKFLGATHKPKIFHFETSSDDYLFNFIKTSLLFIPTSWYVLERLNTKYEVITDIHVFVGLALVIASYLISYLIVRWRGNKVEFIFNDDQIIEKRGKAVNTYFLSELRRIYTNKIDRNKNSTSIDMIIMTFEKNRNLSFSKFEPQFQAIKTYLKKYLSERMNYERYLDGKSKM